MSELLSDAKDGLSQNERRITALFPQNFRVDDKTSLDLFSYMFNLASELHFYDQDNKPDGDWRDFFAANPNLFMSMVARMDFSENLTRFERIETLIQLAANEGELFTQVQNLFDFFAEAVTNLRRLQKRFRGIYSANRLVRKLAVQISDFDDIFSRFKSAHKQFQEEFNYRLKIIPIIDKLPDPADYERIIFDVDAHTTREKINSSLNYIKGLFNELRVRYNNFLGALNYYLQGYDMFKDQHPPHLALVLAFIKLYQHLQEELNDLPRKHLEFYYKEVLGMQQRDPEPDSVHVFFEPEPLVNQVTIEAGKELLAGTFDNKPVIFNTDTTLQVTPARVEVLKSLYVSRQKLSAAADLYEYAAYKADRKVIGADEYGKNGFLPTSWAAMGEDQTRLGLDERSMTEIELATLITSPMLYLAEGERYIIISIYINDESSKNIDAFIERILLLNKTTNTEQIAFNLFNNAFLVDYTVDTGWRRFSKYTTAYERTTLNERYIEIKLEISAQEPAIVLYNAAVHGGITRMSEPAIRITMNNNAPTNPYTFLSNVNINRIKIRAEVKGFTSVRLNNNIGALSAATTFQPFGPMPLAGSYIDIKNTNIFNKYTKDAKVYLEWIGLPDTAGGFTEYYSAYDLKIKTDSFKVKVSAVNNGKNIPGREEQQEINLFDTGYSVDGHESLLTISKLDDINLQPLEFSNEPLMEAEDELRNATFKNGVLRIELTSPAEGFGVSVYPQVFTDIALHNARRFVTKRPVPNPPYIPLVKSLSVDYILENSELLNSAVNHDPENVGLQLIHIHPFGHRKDYPVNNDKARTLFPAIDKARNLYMGLTDVVSGQELSILFYLEDHIFIDTIVDDITITWSYLYHNNWTELGAANILEDTTNSLINTGVIRFRVPYDIHIENTILPTGYFWLRATVDGYPEVYARIIAIYTNAVAATRNFADGQANMPITLLPRSITDFNGKVSGIKRIWQPFASFNGMAQETIDNFYVRVSERLNHKRRPVTITQIEQFVLQHFPDILMAKCASRNEMTTDQTIGPGVSIKVVVIPKIQNKGLLNDSQPRVNMATLFKVHKLLKKAIPSFINIQVANPVYERVKIVASVVFTDNSSLSQQAFLNQLVNDIRLFFCPWLDAGVFDIKIGSKIFVAEILSFIKGLSYVSQVTRFSIVHFFKRSDGSSGEDFHTIEDLAVTGKTYVQASVPEAILIPSDHHLIDVSNSISYQAPARVGIGDMSIGDEFLVINEKEEAKLLTETAEPQPDDEFFNLKIRHF